MLCRPSSDPVSLTMSSMVEPACSSPKLKGTAFFFLLSEHSFLASHGFSRTLGLPRPYLTENDVLPLHVRLLHYLDAEYYSLYPPRWYMSHAPFFFSPAFEDCQNFFFLSSQASSSVGRDRANKSSLSAFFLPVLHCSHRRIFLFTNPSTTNSATRLPTSFLRSSDHSLSFGYPPSDPRPST